MATTSSGAAVAASAAAQTTTNANISSTSSAHSPQLLTLGDLLELQFERLNLDELIYKDELQLQLQLDALDHVQALPQRPRLQRQATSSDTESCLLEVVSQKSNTSGNSNNNVTGKDIPTTTAAVGLAPLSKSESTDDLIGAVGGVALEETQSNKSGGRFTETTTTTTTKTEEFRPQVIQWFQQLHEHTFHFKSDEESRRTREAGNDSYRKERHALKAADFFTEAIFLAPAKNSIAAAMAHANRSTVLYDCGLYAESYDDCLCALDLGYPEEYHSLIKLRQASCALKMRNFKLCEEHLHELLHMELTEVFETRTHELWHQCEILKGERFEMGVQTGEDLAINDSKVYEVAWLDNSNVMTTNRSACMRAIRNLPGNMLIFQEPAPILVPSGNSRVCDNCAITQFVPFPCIYCSNRSAIYCSRQCRTKHAAIHSIECFAHQIELFESFSSEFSKPRLLQLAFRMLITGLPQVVIHCRKKPTLQKMWAAFNGVLTERQDIAYSALLRLDTHTIATGSESEDYKRQTLETLVSLAIVAHILAIYLNKCTSFFEQLENAMPSPAKLSSSEWELLAAALLLRHMCQLRHKNLIHCPSFVLPASPYLNLPLNEFQLWAEPQHVYKGRLHLIAGDVSSIAYAVFPHTLSLCRHACASTIHVKISGRTLSAYTTTDLPAGANVYYCFASGAVDYRQSAYDDRQLDLQSRGIECKCEKCFRPDPDEEFHKFHRYRCDNPKCTQIFTPHNLKYTRNLRWWRSEYYTRPENNGSELLVCHHCNTTQKLEWYWTFNAALTDCDAIEERCKLYAAVERADAQLVEMHELKVALARQLIQQCLFMQRVQDVTLDDWEYNKLGSIIRSALPIVAAQYGTHSLEYVQHFSYFWDIMALSSNSYKCSDKELIEMLNALEYIPDEFKEIFINYYEQYIAPHFMEEVYDTIMDTEV